MKLPWLCICGGVTGDFVARCPSRSNQNSSLVTGTQIGGGFLPHSGSSSLSGSRFDHRAGQDLRADRRRLLDHADANVGLELLQADRERESGRSGADGDDVVFHDVAFAHCRLRFAVEGTIVRFRGGGGNAL